MPKMANTVFSCCLRTVVQIRPKSSQINPDKGDRFGCYMEMFAKYQQFSLSGTLVILFNYFSRQFIFSYEFVYAAVEQRALSEDDLNGLIRVK